ncbi:SDR family NAD(P)-dependent oxidoreductase [Kiritimatiella glycovorans]|uniref:Short-chain dehydrogenase/reductase SDR n=1 Tax=Kiritimatiella glycovorans TaxID=1307763 RepID=A0A0G3EIQ8_9BACT|nr:SDR family oxidoreductase [Kiritimatiella glycovorans]AKJ64715.1 Short-chain dehydrogenase/reductase SDR [Kiritimatiella glycovorans]
MAGTIMMYGGTGGIGEACARELRGRGYGLHLVARSENRLQALAEELEAGFTAGDVNDTETFERAAEEAGRELAGLVYAVGTINLGSFSRLGREDYERDFRVNALGAALAVRSALPALKQSEQPASVVFFSSVAAARGFKWHASMGMAKAAVSGLTVSLAAELAPQVRINAVAPSLTRTPLAAGILSSEKTAAAIAAGHPLPRLGAAQDIAALTAFLVSSDADWITGQVIGVDGGRSTIAGQG